MNFLTQDELKTHLYEEITNEITRDDDGIITDAIDTAIAEAKGYITKYDVSLVFNPVALEDRNAKLLSVVKDIAAWHLIRLSNPNIELPLRRVNYEDAMTWLSKVQAGKIDPLLPMPGASDADISDAGSLDGTVKWESNAKRNNHY